MSTGCGFGQETVAVKYQCEAAGAHLLRSEDAVLPLDAVVLTSELVIEE